MNQQTSFSGLAKATLGAVIGALMMLFLLADPLELHPLDSWLLGQPEAVPSGAVSPQLWTCGMHPEVLGEEPGQCPICGMDLTPVKPAQPRIETMWTCAHHPDINEEAPGECPICGRELVVAAGQDQPPARPALTIEAQVVQNMNVRSEPVTRRDLVRRIRTVGYLDYDQDRLVSVTTRFSGFVEKVYVSYLGQPVTRGEPLFDVYSPQLVQTQQELLAARNYALSLGPAASDVQNRAAALVEAARTRLAYWQIPASAIGRIENSGQVEPTLAVVAPAPGVVVKRLAGLEGMAVSPGMELFQIADLSVLWLTVEVFAEAVPWVPEGSGAAVTFDALPGIDISGRVRFVEPQVSPRTRSARLTLEVANPGGQLRAGMYATVVFDPVVAANALTVPGQAVIRTGERDLVVVALGEGRFEPREVVLGPESEGFVAVSSGLDEHDEVVTSSQFLIDSESNLQAAMASLIASRQGHHQERHDAE